MQTQLTFVSKMLAFAYYIFDAPVSRKSAYITTANIVIKKQYGFGNMRECCLRCRYRMHFPLSGQRGAG
jgi:hypothetical protein